MNRSCLLLLLGASLVGNVSLGYFVLRSSPRISPGDGVVATASVSPSRPSTNPTTSAATELAKKLVEPRTVANLREIAAQLRAAGFTDSVVKMVMNALANEELMRRQPGIYDWMSAPYWKDRRPTPAQMRAMDQIQKEQRALLAEIGLPPTPAEAAERRRQYGNLSNTKIAALEKIKRDYNELRQGLFAAAPHGIVDARDIAGRQKLLEEEQERDIAALLTPEEKLELDLHTSNTANQVRGLFREIDINEQEFRSLYAAQKAYEAANPRNAPHGGVPGQSEIPIAAWDAYQTNVRAALGDERYRQFLVATQLDNGGAKTFFAERPGLTVDQIQAFARLMRSVPEAQKVAGDETLSIDERRAQADAFVNQYHAQAVRILGAQYTQEAVAAGLVAPLRGTGSKTQTVPGGG
ncbi:MAG TPA: hypothetical protein VK477_06080 [Acidobacteriota bacterium]|nr:hypothetical protein [Acidobacteriota bacterium]